MKLGTESIAGGGSKAMTMVVAIATALWVSTSAAAVKPSALFTDNAVLQADREAPVWGWDDPGQTVTVSIGKATATGKADKDGR